jgi:hypothetical protein
MQYTMRFLFSLLFTFLSLGSAHAETQNLRYTLSIDDQAVGHRSLKIRYIPGAYGEKRFIESWTEFEIQIARTPFAYKQRLSGLAKSKPTGFSAVMAEGSFLREVQLVRQPEHWSVAHAERGRTWTLSIAPAEFDATSLTLVDPGAKGFLDNLLRLRVLSAETGKVIQGGLSNQGQSMLSIAGKQITAQHYLWRLDSGDIELAYAETGHLLRYTMSVSGKTLTGTLDTLPPTRTFEEDMPTSLVDGPIEEETIEEETIEEEAL